MAPMLIAILELWFLFDLMDILETKAGKVLTHTQLPLMMAWGIIIHKSQGLTLEKVVVELGDKDFSAGLTFVAIS